MTSHFITAMFFITLIENAQKGQIFSEFVFITAAI